MLLSITSGFGQLPWTEIMWSAWRNITLERMNLRKNPIQSSVSWREWKELLRSRCIFRFYCKKRCKSTGTKVFKRIPLRNTLQSFIPFYLSYEGKHWVLSRFSSFHHYVTSRGSHDFCPGKLIKPGSDWQ